MTTGALFASCALAWPIFLGYLNGTSVAQVVPVLRGRSQNPLYVTGVGLPVGEAARLVASMHGEYRFPTLLKLLDDLTKRVA